MVVWSHANLWEPIAAAQPNAPIFIQGERTMNWGQFDAEADALAQGFIDAGLSQDAKIAAYLYNCPEYLVTYYAAFKTGLAPVNTNYRYGAEELFYLFDNADAEAIVFHASFTPTLEKIRGRLTKVKHWVAIAEPGAPVPTWATDYAKIVATAPAKRPVRAPWGLSNDNLLIIYTGGTTGMPKGVMWRQEDLFGASGFGANILTGQPPLNAPEEAATRLAGAAMQRAYIACPLMHGTGQLSSLAALNAGGSCVFAPSTKFDAAQLWSEVERTGATRIVIVGLAFCAPMLDALDANPGRWDLSKVLSIVSSGAMWSFENKQALLKHIQQAMLIDALGSSEALGLGNSASAAGAQAQTAKFALGPNSAVFTEDGRRVQPGSDERGMVAVSGYLALGYYKDPEKTAKTFMTFEGRRWSVPGDWASVNEDGTLNLLGRGSVCINSGGEKIFPEEVEEALKRHPAVRDACVVGLPDARFGERICAVVEFEPAASPLGLSEISAHVKTQLADYKAPRDLVVVDSVQRAPNGKLDYKTLKELAVIRVAAAR